MKSITIARRYPSSELNDFFEKVRKKEIENPYDAEPKVKSLLQKTGSTGPLRFAQRPNLAHVLEGVMSGHMEIYEGQGGAVLYSEIDSLNFHGYISHLILIGFQDDNPSYQTLKTELEKLASGNPDGFPKTLEDFYAGVPPFEVLQKMWTLGLKSKS